MSLETGLYLGNLVPSNPGGSDPKAQGDDQMRLLKTVLLNSFPGFAGSILVAGLDSGVTNAYTITPTTPLPAYTAKMTALFSPVVANTGAVTLNISGLGAKAIVSTSGAPLVSGDLAVGRYYMAVYDGTQFRLTAITKNYIDQLVISGAIPGVNDPTNAGKFFTTDGVSGGWVALDLRSGPVIDKGNTGSTAQVINWNDGEGQTITATGSHSLTATGFPTDRLAGVLLRMNGYGSHTLTTTGITWFKADGTTTTTFSASGIVLSTGVSNVVLYSFGDGTIYGRVAR